MPIYAAVECAGCGRSLSRRDAHPIHRNRHTGLSRWGLGTKSRVRALRRPRRLEPEAWLCPDCHGAPRVQALNQVVLIGSTLGMGLVAFTAAYFASFSGYVRKQDPSLSAKQVAAVGAPATTSSSPRSSHSVLFPVAEPAPQAQDAREAPLSSPDRSSSGFVADLSDRNNAMRIQVRLIELGYLQDAADGRWGAKSRAALRAFKQASGFSGDDLWDAFTAGQLFSPDALRAPSNAQHPMR